MKKPIALFSVCLTLFSPVAYAASEWTYLFKDAEHGDFYFDSIEEIDPEEVFEFKADGTLQINGEGESDAYIQTLDEYEDYELRFEYRWPKEPGKSGIQIHSTSDTAHSIWPESIEIQLEDENSGDFWVLNTEIEVEEEQMPDKAADRNRRLRLKPEKKPFEYGEPKKELEKDPDQWNAMRIVAKGDTIDVYLNDELVNHGTEASVTSGFITLQAEGSDIEIRNFRIRELDTE